MSSARKRIFTLPDEAVGFVDKLIASGDYADESEVVRAGLEALHDRDAQIEHWLRDEVVPVYDAMQADPNRGIPIEDVSRSLEALHQKWEEDHGR